MNPCPEESINLPGQDNPYLAIGVDCGKGFRNMVHRNAPEYCVPACVVSLVFSTVAFCGLDGWRGGMEPAAGDSIVTFAGMTDERMSMLRRATLIALSSD